jgi:hypothetical protein
MAGGCRPRHPVAPDPRRPRFDATKAPTASIISSMDVGDRLGHYTVTALIGEDGMGRVYRATDGPSARRLRRAPGASCDWTLGLR